MANESTVEKRVRELLFTFGKLGLLIEDAPDARLRTARELYGTDGLPLWWLRFDNLEEGTEALKTAWQSVAQGEPEWAKGLPLLVVLDRYLKESPASPRAVAWDDNEDRPIVATVREVLGEMEKEDPLPVHLEAVTSYSGPSHTSGIKLVPWRLRHHEPLYQLRRRLEEGKGLRPLLFFGPVAKPPVIGYSGQEGIVADEGKRVAFCRARYSQESINALVKALENNDRTTACVLFTGAGASLANDPLAPGIPDTWYLLERACWEVAGRPEERKPVWPPGQATAAKTGAAKKIGSLRELRERYEEGASVRDLDWSLETLFKSVKQRSPDRDTLAEFAAAFRQTLQLWDHDFPYQSWLLSQLPWTLILTTNFDGFHERAAANAAALSSPAAVNDVRRLGDVIPLPDTPGESKSIKSLKVESIEALKKRPGLLKPYGSLMATGAVALTDSDFWPRLKLVGQAFLKPILEKCTECWIVIVGQRLASDALHSVFTDLLNDSGHAEKLRLLWVEPFPYRNDLDKFECFRRFRDVLDGTTQQPFAETPVACPVPVRALDFAVDLWAEWNRRRNQD